MVRRGLEALCARALRLGHLFLVFFVTLVILVLESEGSPSTNQTGSQPSDFRQA